MVVNNQEVFQASYPVLYNNQSLGTLSIGWPTSYFDQIIKENLFYGILIFLSVMIISNSILYYAFQKDKQNVKLAYYDPLTDLPNSHYLHEYVEKISRDTEKHQRALVLVNCSKLEAMNSTYGLSIGNQIIHYVASKLRHIISSEDMVFRFQQDSFVLIIDQYRSVDDLKAMSHRLIDLLNDSTDPQNTFGSIYPQIGIVELNSNFLDADELLQKASLAISANVLNQRDNIHVYHQELQHWMARQEAIESAIKLTLANQQSSVYLVYQPKLDIKSNTIHGFEALARLSTETLGHVSPIEFIALAEKKFLIFDLGNYILLKACQFAKTLEMKGHGHLSVAINISLLQLLRNEFVDCVQQILSETQVNPKQLQFEITESAFVDNFDTVNAKLKEIQQLGISISLDDFGTGYSSFSRLQKLLISEVKIDKTFVDPINVMHDRDLITPEIIAMAQKLGLVVVAEGVEHEAQKEFLTKNNCDIIQGFVYSTPLSEIESIAFVLNNETTQILTSNK
ncbi:MAG: bifunctional diguanylate cyclase/phosphodiesterase [Erysipelothrix sp.]|nr:bifunctional diguanylate cyclase/phosphodiesterase [Erysipelothrix sp.]